MARATTDAITLLKEDHRKVEALFEQFEKAQADRKRKLAKQICTELTVHAMIEEEIFYPACKGKIEDEEVLEEAYVEHDGTKVLISEISKAGAGDEFFDAKVKVLSEMIKHHVKEEEKRSDGLLAQAKAAGLDIQRLGEQLLQRKNELMQEIDPDNLPDPKTRSYKGHKLIQSTPLEAPAA